MSLDNIVSEAEENLRLIRAHMERSKRYSNFAGFSGVFGGLIAIVGAFVQRLYILGLPTDQRALGFVLNWLTVIVLSLSVDYVFTRRRENLLEKAVVVRLTRHMARVAVPALLFGVLISVTMLRAGRQDELYAYWMLSYGSAMAALGISAPREVAWLGWSFLAAGAITLLMQTFGPSGLVRAQFGLVMFILTFGIFHIAYGLVVAKREGW